MTASRVTIMLNDEIKKKLHEMQANAIKTSALSVSFSEVVNQVLERGLKK